MKKLAGIVLIIISVCGVSACTHQSVNTGSISGDILPQLGLNATMPMTKDNLVGQWQLEDSPLVLSFGQDDVAVLNGCNHVRAKYQITHDKLTISSPISARMMCEPSLMQIDELATQLFQGEFTIGYLMSDVPKTAIMTIRTDGGLYILHQTPKE